MSGSSAPALALPRLLLGPTLEVLPAPPEGAQRWEDPGRSVSLCWREDGGARLSVSDLGLFLFRDDPEAATIELRALPGVSEAWARHAYERQALPFFLADRGERVLHASAVELPRGVLVLCADSGVGKSTTAFGLHERGFDLWADDAVILRPLLPRGTSALRLPHTIRLRPPAAAHFGDTWRRFAESGGPEALAKRDPEEKPLAGLCVLERKERGAPELKRLAPAAALSLWLRHAYCFSLQDPKERRDFVEGYMRLAERVPLRRLRFVPDFASLDALLDTLLEPFLGI